MICIKAISLFVWQKNSINTLDSDVLRKRLDEFKKYNDKQLLINNSKINIDNKKKNSKKIL